MNFICNKILEIFNFLFMKIYFEKFLNCENEISEIKLLTYHSVLKNTTNIIKDGQFLALISCFFPRITFIWLINKNQGLTISLRYCP